MSDKIKKSVVQELVESIKAAGFKVFVAKSGTHGFYTDETGDRLISFQVPFLSPVFSGHYCRQGFRTGQRFGSKSHGTGWRITVTSPPEDAAGFKRLLYTPIPYWAKENGLPFRHTTVAEHLAFFGDTSGYIEI